MKHLILIFLFASVFVGCKHDSLYTPADEPPLEETECDPNMIYFVNDVLPIIQSNCAFSGCHGGGSAADGIELSTYNGIMDIVNPGNPNDSELYDVITETGGDIMPPSPYAPLSSEQIQTIREWILQGAVNNECTDCNMDNITFSGTVWAIIQNSCTGCHNSSNTQGGISIENYNEVVALGQNGSLMGTINHDSGYVAMPYNGAQLSQCKIDQVQDWVDQGMPNN
jgi:mono/diheme cytochrome c family protein